MSAGLKVESYLTELRTIFVLGKAKLEWLNRLCTFVKIIDCFHVVDGQIVSIRVYYDPRPILEA